MKLKLALLVCLSAAGASAEVADSSTNGFTVKLSVPVSAAPQAAYRQFLRVSGWWDPSHTFSQNAANLYIDDKAMGCWCEHLSNGGEVRHLQLVRVEPGKALVFTGGLGPLQSLGVAGSMTVQFVEAEGGSKIALTYAVGGYAAGGLDKWSAPVEEVLKIQLTRLKNKIEHGDPAKDH